MGYIYLIIFSFYSKLPRLSRFTWDGEAGRDLLDNTELLGDVLLRCPHGKAQVFDLAVLGVARWSL